jgi:N-acetylglucosamine kinase-like BadF-type ATPase
MKCVLGLDGGGTKTECVVLNEAGAILARATGPPSNPTRIGFTAAFAAIQETCALAINSTRITLDVLALCAGLAGTGLRENHDQMKQFLAQRFPSALIDVRMDIELPLAAVPPGPAIVLIAGTGSAAIGRNIAGSMQREGGFGPASSDEGSAFDIGRSAVAAARAVLSNAESDQLTQQIFQHLAISSWHELDAKSTASPDSVYPPIFPVVAAAADAGNAVAQSVLSDAAKKLAAISQRLAESLNLLEQPFHLAKTGGTIGRSRFFDRAIDRELRSKLPNAIMNPLQVQPAEIAAWLALQLLTNGAGAAP